MPIFPKFNKSIIKYIDFFFFVYLMKNLHKGEIDINVTFALYFSEIIQLFTRIKFYYLYLA